MEFITIRTALTDVLSFKGEENDTRGKYGT